MWSYSTVARKQNWRTDSLLTTTFFLYSAFILNILCGVGPGFSSTSPAIINSHWRAVIKRSMEEVEGLVTSLQKHCKHVLGTEKLAVELANIHRRWRESWLSWSTATVRDLTSARRLSANTDSFDEMQTILRLVGTTILISRHLWGSNCMMMHKHFRCANGIPHLEPYLLKQVECSMFIVFRIICM